MNKTVGSSGIYGIFNIKSGRAYIGKSMNIDQRWHEHLYMLRNGVHVNGPLQADWEILGESAFEFRIVRHTEGFAELYAAEAEEMAKYPDKYNIASPGQAKKRQKPIVTIWRGDPDLIWIQEAQEEYGRNRRTLDSLIDKGDLHPVEFLGDKRRYLRRSELDAKLGKPIRDVPGHDQTAG